MHAVQNVQMSNQPSFGCLKSHRQIAELMKLKRARGINNKDIQYQAAHSVKSKWVSVLKDAFFETNAILVQSVKDFFAALRFKPKNITEPFSSNRFKTSKN